MTCTLLTSGFRFTLSVGDLAKARDKWAEYCIQLTLNEGFSGNLSAITTSYSPIDDLNRLANYFAKYIFCVRRHEANDDIAEPWVPLDVAYQVLVSDGNVFQNDDGEITLAIHVNVGKEDRRVYIGAQATARFADVLRFVRDVQDLAQRVTAIAGE
jgi:hypothetical protein